MKNSLFISLCIVFQITAVFSESREPLPGLHYYGCDHKADGRIIFLWAQTTNSNTETNMVEHVMALDVDSSNVAELFRAPSQSRLFMDYSGNWGSLLYQKANPSKGAELLFFSLQNHSTYRTSCPSEDTSVVIVGNHAYIQMGRPFHCIIEDHDLLSGKKKTLRIAGDLPLDGEEYYGANARVCDNQNVYVCYDPHGSDSGLMKGLYAYNIQSGTSSRIGETTDFYDITPSGAAVRWAPQELGWALSIHEPNKRGGVGLYESKGTIIFRDHLNGLIFKQITPCGNHAVFVKTCGTFGLGLRTQVYLCDLRTGKTKLLLEAKASKEAQMVPFVDPYWVK